MMSRGSEQLSRVGLQALPDIDVLQELVTHLSPVAAYLSTAEAVLPSDHIWVESMKTARREVLIRSSAKVTL